MFAGWTVLLFNLQETGAPSHWLCGDLGFYPVSVKHYGKDGGRACQLCGLVMAENDSRSSLRLTSHCTNLGLMGRVGPNLVCFAACRMHLNPFRNVDKKVSLGLLFSRQTSSLNFSGFPLLPLVSLPHFFPPPSENASS